MKTHDELLQTFFIAIAKKRCEMGLHPDETVESATEKTLTSCQGMDESDKQSFIAGILAVIEQYKTLH